VNVGKAIINLFRFDRTNWKAVALCIVAATVFWFFNSLNKEHTATISYPLNIQYDQARFIPVKPLPTHVALNITGSGWDLLRKSLGFKVTPLTMTLEKPTETFKIPPASLLSLAAVQLGVTRINHVANDTLHLRIEPRSRRKLKLAVNTRRLRFELGFGRASNISISPDSILLEGPHSLIAQMPDTLVLPFSTARISQSVKTDVDISFRESDNIRSTPSTASVAFDVDELKDIPLSVKVIVLPASPYRFQVSDDSTRLVLRVPSKLSASLKEKLGLVALIDLRELDAGVSKVSPHVKGLPAFAEVLMVDSVTIRKY
jgi:hypothetical protein